MAGISAGDLRERVSILSLGFEEANNRYQWTETRKIWADVELDTRSNLFSSVGIGARGVTFTIRRNRELSLHQAFSWKGKHCFLTSIIPHDHAGYLTVKAALVDVVTCLATRTEDTVGEAGRPTAAETLRVTFPGILTEKYVRYEREETHAESDTSYVLVTPKKVQLKEGDLVTIQEGPGKGVYHVTVCHVLDEYKNEYEIAQRGDV